MPSRPGNAQAIARTESKPPEVIVVKSPSSRATLLAASLCLSFGPVFAADDHSQHQHHQHHQVAAEPAAKSASAEVKYGDTVLVDQAGRKVKLKSEVFGDRLVVIDFAYTNCTTICPVLTSLLAKVQDGLGERMGKEVSLVTITVDPARDTAPRLKEYAAKHGVKPGWTWLTGPTGTVNETLKGFGAYAVNFEDHPPMVLVGDPKTNTWTRFFGFSDPKTILARVDELAHARHMAGGAAGAVDHSQHKH
jgi:protein SCO1/2